MNYTYDFVNFDDVSSSINNTDTFDETTTEKYRIMRLCKIDPIMNEEVPEHLMFKFKYKWNPITGIREEIDEYGPLCFDAWNLYQYYYINRCNGLWIPPTNNFQGYYGDLVGCGNDIYINGKYCPEKYLFRLPIIDCYLKKSHNHSLITMGPKLTDEEIQQIDTLTLKLRKNGPSLKMLKEYYDQSLNISPDITELKRNYSCTTEMELKDKYNRIYVDKLVNMPKY